MEFNEAFTVIVVGCCNARFAVPTTSYDKWQKLRDRTTFWCPHCGSARHFIGESPEQKKLRAAEERLQQERARANVAEHREARTQKQYRRMRSRVRNGVCPCCNRSFEALARHMQSQHPEFGREKTIKTLRLLYGLTQSELAHEIGISSAQVSQFERTGQAAASASSRIDLWIGRESITQ